MQTKDKFKQFEEILITRQNMHSNTGAHQHHVPSTANNNEDLTNDESSNQEGSDSQEIVELEWSNIISFVCDRQLFELFTYTCIFKTKMLWRVI